MGTATGMNRYRRGTRYRHLGATSISERSGENTVQEILFVLCSTRINELEIFTTHTLKRFRKYHVLCGQHGGRN